VPHFTLNVRGVTGFANRDGLLALVNRSQTDTAYVRRAELLWRGGSSSVAPAPLSTWRVSGRIGGRDMGRPSPVDAGAAALNSAVVCEGMLDGLVGATEASSGGVMSGWGYTLGPTIPTRLPVLSDVTNFRRSPSLFLLRPGEGLALAQCGTHMPCAGVFEAVVRDASTGASYVWWLPAVPPASWGQGIGSLNARSPCPYFVIWNGSASAVVEVVRLNWVWGGYADSLFTGRWWQYVARFARIGGVSNVLSVFAPETFVPLDPAEAPPTDFEVVRGPFTSRPPGSAQFAWGNQLNVLIPSDNDQALGVIAARWHWLSRWDITGSIAQRNAIRVLEQPVSVRPGEAVALLCRGFGLSASNVDYLPDSSAVFDVALNVEWVPAVAAGASLRVVRRHRVRG
jgi:hypothetical protein